MTAAVIAEVNFWALLKLYFFTGYVPFLTCNSVKQEIHQHAVILLACVVKEDEFM